MRTTRGCRSKSIERWVQRRVLFFNQHGFITGSVPVPVKVYWPDGKVVEEALKLKPNLSDYDQVSIQ